MLNKMLANTLKLEMLHANTISEKITIIAKYAKRATDAERCSIFLYDKDTDQLRSVYADGIQGNITLKSNIGIVGYAFHKKTSIIENNPLNSALFFKVIDQKTHYKTEKILATPILHNQHKLGVLELLNKKSDFIEEDKSSAELLSQHLNTLFTENTQKSNNNEENSTTLLEENLDSYLTTKKLYLMENGSAYYKLLGMKREYFLAADEAHILKETDKKIKIFYYTSNDFLSIDMLVKIEEDVQGILIAEHSKTDLFELYSLEEE